MNRVPLVSIIITNFNYGRFLGEAIDSALAQSYPDVEVVVVDDGSTDDSREVIAGYGERLVAVLKENGGQGSAVNAGFAASRGEIVIFLDADDVLLPETVQRVVEAFRSNPDVIKVQYTLRIADASGRPTGGTVPTNQDCMPQGDLRRQIMRFHSYPQSPMSGNALASSALRRILPMPETELYHNVADVYINDLIAMFGPVTSLKEPGALYREHGANASLGWVGLHFHSLDEKVRLDRLEQQIIRADNQRAEQKRLFKLLYSIEVREVGKWDLPLLIKRMIHVKLSRVDNRFASDLVALCIRGCIAYMIYPGVRGWYKRAFGTLWFAGMLVTPKPLAEPLAQGMLQQEKSVKSLARKLPFAAWRTLAKARKREQSTAG